MTSQKADNALSSMTGFGRSAGESGALRWSWEIKSVNGRGLEARFRLPPGFDHLEPRLRKGLSAPISRGSIQAALLIDKASGDAGLAINRQALDVAIDMISEIRERIETDNPRPEAILALRGIIDDGQRTSYSDEERAALDDAICESFNRALSALASARREEGVEMARALTEHIDEINALTNAARKEASAGPDAIKAKIGEQLDDLLSKSGAEISSDRLEQEIAVLAVKADVREELDRLEAHIASARELMIAAGPIGRKFDFLTQEFNREANTLCAKAATTQLKQTGLALKAVIDQLREQVQNIE